jgi:pimeloyl-ACP methyl ester carboxylesterase
VPQRRPDRIVTIAAPSDMADVFRWAGRLLGLGAAAQQAFERQVFRFAGRPLSEFQVERMMHDLQIRTLVIHAEDDKEVAFSNAEAIARLGPHVRLMKANGFGHRRIVAAPPVTQAVVEFLKEGTGAAEIVGLPLPCVDEANTVAAAEQGSKRRLA